MSGKNDGTLTLPERFEKHEKECKVRYDRIWKRINLLTMICFTGLGGMTVLEVLTLAGVIKLGG
ncbi:MAG: hypothetical protein OXC14_04010 [Rhodospirillaceae bacterium]|nr:hypothetical protein [Rhodospirillaceae bacterium]